MPSNLSNHELCENSYVSLQQSNQYFAVSLHISFRMSL